MTLPRNCGDQMTNVGSLDNNNSVTPPSTARGTSDDGEDCAADELRPRRGR